MPPRRRGVGTGGQGGQASKFSKVPFFREQSALYLLEKCRSDCIFCPTAFDLWLHLFLYFGVSWKILLYSRKIILCPENYFHIPKKIWYLGKNFWYVRKIFFIFGKKMLNLRKIFWHVRKIFWDDLPPPPSPTFPGKIFKCPFVIRKVPLKAWPLPPTFRCFLRPCQDAVH
jgi:hypothetical protein